MDQDKRHYRRLKRDIKRAGNKRRRQHLKRDLADNPEEAPFTDFDFGRNSSRDLTAWTKTPRAGRGAAHLDMSAALTSVKLVPRSPAWKKGNPFWLLSASRLATLSRVWTCSRTRRSSHVALFPSPGTGRLRDWFAIVDWSSSVPR